MSQNVYEGMFLLDTGKTAGDWNNATSLVHGILEKNEATLVASRPWDERALAYPMSGTKRGMYLLTYFKAEGGSITSIESDCKINDSVLRQLVLKVEPKLVDELVKHAMESPSDKAEESEETKPAEKAAVEVAATAKEG